MLDAARHPLPHTHLRAEGEHGQAAEAGEECSAYSNTSSTPSPKTRAMRKARAREGT